MFPILIVDDDDLLRNLLVEALEDERYLVRAARNGVEGLALLQHWQPALILLDLMMPLMDGWTFRARQLELNGARDIPVIVLSAGLNLRYGVDELRPTAIVPKPFNLDSLLATVARILQRQ